MKIFCHVNQKPALIVGYAPGRKGKPVAIVITEGVLKSIRLKDLDLGQLPTQLLRNAPASAEKAPLEYIPPIRKVS